MRTDNDTATTPIEPKNSKFAGFKLPNVTFYLMADVRIPWRAFSSCPIQEVDQSVSLILAITF